MSNTELKNAISLFFTSVAIICTCIFSFVPITALAAYEKFPDTKTCADIITSGTANCSGSTLNINHGGAYWHSSLHYGSNSAHTLYTVYTATLSSGIGNFDFGNTNDNLSIPWESGANVQISTDVTSGLNTLSGNIIIFNNPGGESDATFTSVCISDTSFEECGGSPTPTPTPVASSTVQIFSTTTQLIDNPNQDYMMGMLLFLIGMFSMLLIFKGRR